jgi:hypothetical protein
VQTPREPGLFARIPGAPCFYPALLLALLGPLYLFCLPPGLPPYRDAGEMAGAAWTLGLAHQPGYPLYIIGAKLFSLLPLGNPAWRLNLFSSAAGLAGLLIFLRVASRSFHPAAAFAAALLLGLNFTLRTVSMVPEMYALHFLFAALLLLLAGGGEEQEPGPARVYATAYLLGLGMANRMDLLLAAPAALLLLWPRIRAGGPLCLPRASGFALLGFSLYLFLPVRSSSWPLFDWSHPADPATFLAVITRKSYGSTLDLISVNYRPGELFLPNLKLYWRHLLENFNGFLLFCAAGVLAEYRSAPRRLAAWGALFLVTGPLFLYLANMPPNPHAAAIVEPYYLLPDLALAFWAAAGLAAAFSRLPRFKPALLAAALACAGLALHNGAPACRRWLFAAEDYARDVLRTAPQGATVVAKKDVQLFSLWYLQRVLGERPDVLVVAQGLSASAWYAASMARHFPSLKLENLNTGGETAWRALAASSSGGLFATLDSELPASLRIRPFGLLNEIEPGARPPRHDPWPYYSAARLSRPYHDFFDRDLGTSYAQGLMSRVVAANAHGGMSAPAARAARLARVLDEEMPDAALYEGFWHFGRGDWAAAAAAFRASCRDYDKMLALTEEYHSLPDLKYRLRRSAAYAWLNLGVALEKSGDRAGAEAAYLGALRLDPAQADAHFNLAVLFWNTDPARVRRELAETLRINPSHAGALRYISSVR